MNNYMKSALSVPLISKTTSTLSGEDVAQLRKKLLSINHGLNKEAQNIAYFSTMVGKIIEHMDNLTGYKPKELTHKHIKT